MQQAKLKSWQPATLKDVLLQRHLFYHHWRWPGITTSSVEPRQDIISLKSLEKKKRRKKKKQPSAEHWSVQDWLVAHSIQAQVCHLYREGRGSKQEEKWSFFLEQIRADRFLWQTGISGDVREMLQAFLIWRETSFGLISPEVFQTWCSEGEAQGP